MSTVSFEALPITSIAVKSRIARNKPLTRTEKLKKTIKNGMTIDKLPQTGFIVGMILPLPFMSVILPAIGFVVKYSYKKYNSLSKLRNKSLDKIV